MLEKALRASEANLGFSRICKKGVAEKSKLAGFESDKIFLVFAETLTYIIQQELACFKTFPSKTLDLLD